MRLHGACDQIHTPGILFYVPTHFQTRYLGPLTPMDCRIISNFLDTCNSVIQRYHFDSILFPFLSVYKFVTIVIQSINLSNLPLPEFGKSKPFQSFDQVNDASRSEFLGILPMTWLLDPTLGAGYNRLLLRHTKSKSIFPAEDWTLGLGRNLGLLIISIVAVCFCPVSLLFGTLLVTLHGNRTGTMFLIRFNLSSPQINYSTFLLSSFQMVN